MSSKVSLIIPNFNYGNFVEDAVYCALTQSISIHEIIVIDDCSTDNSSEILEQFEAQCRVIRNEQNLGIVENFKKAVSLSEGDYVVFLGADNTADKTFVEKLQRALDETPAAGVAYCDIILFGSIANVLAERVGAEDIGRGRYHWRFPDPTPEALASIREENFINGSSMFRREAYDKVGGFRLTDGPEDADLFLRMIEAGYEAAHVTEPLLNYRQHSLAQANTVLLNEATIRELRRSLDAAQEWNVKSQADFEELHRYVKKLEVDNSELRSEVDRLWDEKRSLDA